MPMADPFKKLNITSAQFDKGGQAIFFYSVATYLSKYWGVPEPPSLPPLPPRVIGNEWHKDDCYIFFLSRTHVGVVVMLSAMGCFFMTSENFQRKCQVPV